MDKEFLIFIIGTILFLAFIVGLGYKTEQISCSAKATAINCDYEFGWWQGCVLIKPDGKRILLEQLRSLDN